MPEKIKVRQEIADAIVWSIQWHRKNRPELETMRDIHAEMLSLSTSESFQGKYEEVLNEVPTFDLAEMLIKGYEIETPKETLARIFQLNQDDSNDAAVYFNKGLKTALHILGIKIKGINE